MPPWNSSATKSTFPLTMPARYIGSLGDSTSSTLWQRIILHRRAYRQSRGHKLFQAPAGTSALRKTVNCQIDRPEDTSVILSIPDVLGALILKGAAYKADTRDRGRHLDDAALLCCALESPSEQAQRLQGSDRGRIRVLADELCDPTHRSWSLVPGDLRQFGIQALEVLAANPSSPPKSPRRLGD
jgi:hypothetical protein